MRLIAHRGNINGPNSLRENHPDYIDEAISKGYDVEIDIRYSPLVNKMYLGHDVSTYGVNPYWLSERMDKLWIHCKNIDALYYFSSNMDAYNYFWHQQDYFTLTSKKYIWTYPNQPYTSRSIIVMPEYGMKHEELEKLIDFKTYNCYAICSDYVGYLNV